MLHIFFPPPVIQSGSDLFVQATPEIGSVYTSTYIFYTHLYKVIFMFHSKTVYVRTMNKKKQIQLPANSSKQFSQQFLSDLI